MEINIGKCVVYRSSEICRVVGIENRCFDGKTQREYFVLSPVGSQRATYYVPREVAGEKLRDLLTKDEILGIIDGIGGAAPETLGEGADRKTRQNEILSGTDYARILRMARSLHLEQQKRFAAGKRLTSADEKAMKAAETLIKSEFGYVLGIDSDKVGEFIRERIGEE